MSRYKFDLSGLKENPPLGEDENVYFGERVICRDYFLGFIPYFPVTVLVITDRRVILVKKRFFGSDKIESREFSDLDDPGISKMGIIRSFLRYLSVIPIVEISLELKQGGSFLEFYIPYFKQRGMGHVFTMPDNSRTKRVYNLIKEKAS